MSIPNPTVFASANTPLLAQATQSSASASTSASVSASTSASTSSGKGPAVPELGYRLPENTTLQTAVKWGIIEDKPIMMDYWVNSLQKTALIGVHEGKKERMLVKSEDEYTSPIAKLFNVENDFIIMTENSIYLVDSKIQRRKIT